MQSSPQFAVKTGSRAHARREDVTYQIMTIAAMLIVLVTVWVF
jgi:hypothetical protein